MGDALTGFQDELKRTNQFSSLGVAAGAGFDRQIASIDAAVSDFRSRAQDSQLSGEQRAAAASQADEQEAEAEKVRAAKIEWNRDVGRVWVLRLVTAFEVFLRQLIIEKAALDEAMVRHFLRARNGLQVDAPLLIGSAADATDRVGDCVDRTLETFSDLDQVNTYFCQWFGPGQGFLNQDRLAVPLGTKADKAAALADVRILFQLRHILVHKSGVPNAKYHSLLSGDQCISRLDASLINAGRVDAPDRVLASRAKYPGNASKRDDLYQSLLMLAEHVDALYA